jgi:hypothetical protein
METCQKEGVHEVEILDMRRSFRPLHKQREHMPARLASIRTLKINCRTKHHDARPLDHDPSICLSNVQIKYHSP